MCASWCVVSHTCLLLVDCFSLSLLFSSRPACTRAWCAPPLAPSTSSRSSGFFRPPLIPTPMRAVCSLRAACPCRCCASGRCRAVAVQPHAAIRNSRLSSSERCRRNRRRRRSRDSKGTAARNEKRRTMQTMAAQSVNPPRPDPQSWVPLLSWRWCPLGLWRVSFLSSQPLAARHGVTLGFDSLRCAGVAVLSGWHSATDAAEKRHAADRATIPIGVAGVIDQQTGQESDPRQVGC